MSELVTGIAAERLVAFALVVARVAGLCLIAPIFGARMLPPRVRVAIVLCLAVAMLPAATQASAPPLERAAAPTVLIALVVEMAIGVLLGLIAQFVFAAVQVAGELAGVQMGFGLAALIDPQTHDRGVALSQWQTTFALLLFLAVDGHHVLIQAVAESFRRIPAGATALSGAAIGMTLAFAGEIFVLALQVAAPVVLLILLVNACLGALAKLIPQLNVMVVGFPITVAAGLFMLAAAQPFTLRLLEAAFGRLGESFAAVIDALA